MPSIHETGPFTYVWETDEETFDKYHDEYENLDAIYVWYEKGGRSNDPDAVKIWNRMNEIGNMFSGDKPFIQEGTTYFAKGMIGEISLYRRRDLKPKNAMALNPLPEEME
jgi:hypothetical protein